MRFTKKLVCDFIENSNAIEDIVTPREVIEHVYDMVKKPKVSIEYPLLDRHPEVVNTLCGIEYLKIRKKLVPTIQDVLTLHSIVMDSLMPMRDEGSFRAVSVSVGGDSTPPPSKVRALMERWIQLRGSLKDRLQDETIMDQLERGIIIPSPEDSAKLCGIIDEKTYTEAMTRHCEFETIHPFSDGNGRVGRLLHLWDSIRTGEKFRLIKVSQRPQYYVTIKLYKTLLRPLSFSSGQLNEGE